MFELALPVGIAAEWWFGLVAHSFTSLAHGSLRALMFAALVWLVLEAFAVAWRAVDSLDG